MKSTAVFFFSFSLNTICRHYATTQKAHLLQITKSLATHAVRKRSIFLPLNTIPSPLFLIMYFFDSLYRGWSVQYIPEGIFTSYFLCFKKDKQNPKKKTNKQSNRGIMRIIPTPRLKQRAVIIHSAARQRPLSSLLFTPQIPGEKIWIKTNELGVQ